jgi:hypothetical protein
MHPNIVQTFEYRMIQLEASYFDTAASRGGGSSTHTTCSLDNLSSVSRGLRQSLLQVGTHTADSSDSDLRTISHVGTSIPQRLSNTGQLNTVPPSPLRHGSQALQPLTSATLALPASLPASLPPRPSAVLGGADTSKRSQGASTADSLDDVGSLSTGLFFRRSTSSAMKGKTPRWLPVSTGLCNALLSCACCQVLPGSVTMMLIIWF